jgi:outer membrane lipoprotein-sorting protein
MTKDNERPLSAFARDVVEVCRNLTGFEATETVEAGPIRVAARIAFHRPDRLAVEYRTYTSPLLELEEHLTGDAEYTADELVGLSLHFDGRRTWIYDASTGVCVVKASRSLFDPLVETPVLGEIDYLRDLPHDYLLRDLGPETIDDRDTHVLSLKPKRQHRTHAFKRIAFLTRKASVAFDDESLFPVRLCFSPAPASQLRRLLGPESTITVRYSDVRLNPDAPPPFAPPEGARVFHEDWTATGELAERLPFPLSLGPLHEAGYESIDGHALLAEDAAHTRAYCAAMFYREGESNDEPTQLVTLRAGNYLNRNMARRRVLTAEAGEELTIDHRTARFLDRRALWEEHASGIDPSQAPVEVSWEVDGVFSFLTGVNTERQLLMQLASDLIEESRPRP